MIRKGPNPRTIDLAAAMIGANMEMGVEYVVEGCAFIGSQVYARIIDHGALPSSAGWDNVAHGVTDLDLVLPGFPRGIVYQTGSDLRPLPYVYSHPYAMTCRWDASDSKIYIWADRSMYRAYVLGLYTKS